MEPKGVQTYNVRVYRGINPHALEDILCNAVNIYRSVIPSLDDHVYGVDDNNPAQIASRLIQNQVLMLNRLESQVKETGALYSRSDPC